MKKILLLFICFFIANVGFSQTYEEYFSKAKQYESEGMWVNALASYYDAFEKEPTLKGLEAYNSFLTLAEVIENGNPGFGEFDDFDLHDGWANIQIEYEKYWIENSPRYFSFGELIKGDNNYEKRTTDYLIKIVSKWTPKYLAISRIIENGYKGAYESDWKDLDRNWPSKGFFKEYRTEGYEGYEFISTYEQDRDLIDPISDYYIRITDNPFFLINFSVYTSDGTIIIENKTAECGSISKINNLSQDVVKKLKSNDLKIEINSVMLKKINYEVKNYCYVTEYDKKNNYPIEAINAMEKVIKNKQREEKAQVIKQDYLPKMVKVQGGTYTRQKQKYKKYNNYDERKEDDFNVTVSDFWIGETELTQDLYELVMDNNPSNNKGAKLPVECVSWYEAIGFCNELSIIMGYTPCYTINDITDPFDWKWDSQNPLVYGKITINLDADGYRLPTEAEWEYCFIKGNDKDILDYDEIAWYPNNSDGKTHEVATKKPNSLGIYDLIGNVVEWCNDFYGSYEIGYKINPLQEKGDSYGNDMVVCGDYSFYNRQGYGTSYYRYSVIGFRVVRSIR